MKNVMLFFLLICSVTLSAQRMNIKMPKAYYYDRTPQQSKQLKFTIATKIEGINLITTNNKNSERLTANSVNRRGKGNQGILLAIPKLYKISFNGNEKVFSFGRAGGENGVDDATVKLSYKNLNPSNTVTSNDRPIMMEVTNSEIHTTNSTVEKAIGNTENFLKIEASKTKPATLEINRNSNQGNVIVCIFDDNNGNLLGTLNPKDPDNPAATLSFTTDKNVYVIPVIRPKVTSANGKDIIVFEVGDPQENGRAEAEEE